ncbi:MAG: leucine-rich repeat domain-containing protein [Clostridiales bacterium]|nr:leucine-rich repeat domain-containing protein [Clostridiales bacterium]
MKRKLTTILIALVAVIACALCLVACGGRGSGSGSDGNGNNNNNNNNNNATVVGTYYLYYNENLDDSLYYVFRNNRWTDADDLTGRYAVNGNKLSLYMEVFGEDELYDTGTVNGDDISMSDGTVFRKGEDLSSKPKRLAYELSEDELHYIVTGIGTEDGDVVVPETYRQIPVTEIDYRAFQRCTRLTSIEIPESVTVLGGQAFSNCTNLTEVKIYGKITELPESIFEGCTRLVDITLPETLISIDWHAFTDCDAVKNVFYLGTPSQWASINFDVSHRDNALSNYIPYFSNPISGYDRRLIIDGQTLEDAYIDTNTVSADAFYNYQFLKSVTLGTQTYSVEGYAFALCSNLKTMSIESVSWIAEHAFESTGITAVQMNSGIIGESAFDGCISLTAVELKSVTVIGESAFSRCLALSNVSLGDAVTEISDNAFSHCSAMTQITIPESVMSIGKYAFNDTGLTEVTFENTVDWMINKNGKFLEVGSQNLAVESSAAKWLSKGDNDNGYTAYPWNVNVLEFVLNSDNVSYTAKRVANKTPVRVTIPTEYKDLPVTRAELNYSGIVVIYCQAESSSELSITASRNCPIIWNCDSNDKDINGYAYKIVGEVLYALKDNQAIVKHANASLSGALTIPSKLTYKEKDYAVTTINDGVFANNNNLTSIVIPSSVTNIGSNVFSNCSALTIYCEVSIKPSGWSSSWNSSCVVIWNCRKNDKSNSGYAYIAINGIRYRLKDGEASVISQPTNISGSIKLLTSILYKGSTNSVTSIGSEAFRNCSSLTSVVIPNSVTSIGSEAFRDCSSLTSVAIGDSVTSIGEYAFFACINLTSVTIGNNVTIIGKDAFSNCSSLTSITIPNSVTSIGSYAFSSCSGLTSVTIGNNVTSIGSRAFSFCSKLTSIEIPNSVTSIEKWAFSGCSDLTIYCEAASKPSGWDSGWNDNCPVIWDYKNK